MAQAGHKIRLLASHHS